MRTTSVWGLALLGMVTIAAPAWSGDAPSAADGSFYPPLASAPPANTLRQAGSAQQAERRTLDPSTCASLCRLFEFLGSLERRKPIESVPTS